MRLNYMGKTIRATNARLNHREHCKIFVPTTNFAYLHRLATRMILEISVMEDLSAGGSVTMQSDIQCPKCAMWLETLHHRFTNTSTPLGIQIDYREREIRQKEGYENAWHFYIYVKALSESDWLSGDDSLFGISPGPSSGDISGLNFEASSSDSYLSC